MGMTGKQIVRLFFLEALFIAIIGSFIGVILGSILTIPLGNVGLNMQDAMEGISMEVSGIFYPVLSWGIVIKVFVFSTVIASLASFIPSRRAAKINPIEALRSE
jgi:putative ABC transport system permease protein